MKKHCVRTNCNESTVVSRVTSALAMLLVFLFTMGVSSCKNDDGDLTKGSLNGTEWTCVLQGTDDIINICFKSKTVDCFLTYTGALKGQVSSCDYKKDGKFITFDDLSLTLYPYTLDSYTRVFKSAKISGDVMEVYTDLVQTVSKPTPAYTLRRVK